MRLETRSVEKPWGRDALPPPFVTPAGQRIGEIWFVPPPELDRLLVKYIFTSEKLSVQVHPSDAQVPGDGKEECWLVIDAEPGAQLGIGFTHEIGREELRAAALDGSIERLLEWRPVAAGDFFSIPPGTVHALGGGVSLVEIQQNRDITYRLYDYGRPRELHLDQAVAVSNAGPYAAALHHKLAEGETGTLIDGAHFRVDLAIGQPDAFPGPLLAVPLSGTVLVEGETIAAGQCAMAGDLSEVKIADGTRCVLAHAPG